GRGGRDGPAALRARALPAQCDVPVGRGAAHRRAGTTGCGRTGRGRTGRGRRRREAGRERADCESGRPGRDVNPQLPLDLRWPARQRFDTFVAGDNALAVASMQRAAGGTDREWLYLCGPPASGKTHLLMASCAAASLAGRSAQYVALASVPEPRADAIRALGGSELLALDELDAIAGPAE